MEGSYNTVQSIGNQVVSRDDKIAGTYVDKRADIVKLIVIQVGTALSGDQ
jgi:hypothetical protein